jgi:tRNA G46 methylase TrmB
MIEGASSGSTPLPIPDGPVVEADLGCGTGDFLLGRASSEPDGFFVGLDRDLASLETARARAAELGLDNLLFERVDLGEVELSDLFFASPVARFHIHFPDELGWISERLLHQIAELLRPRGELFIQTEQAAIARALVRRIEAIPLLLAQPEVAESPFEGAASAEERFHLAAGNPISRLLYLRSADGFFELE